METGWAYYDGTSYKISSQYDYTYKIDYGNSTSTTYEGINIESSAHDQTYTIIFRGMSYMPIPITVTFPQDPFLIPKPGSMCNSLLRSMKGLWDC